jgi:aryl-alcohol dehydrogenase-like predicted oxidoreductase
MGMSEFYGATDEAESLKTIDRALELGITFLDTADMHGSGANESPEPRRAAVSARLRDYSERMCSR